MGLWQFTIHPPACSPAQALTPTHCCRCTMALRVRQSVSPSCNPNSTPASRVSGSHAPLPRALATGQQSSAHHFGRAKILMLNSALGHFLGWLRHWFKTYIWLSDFVHLPLHRRVYPSFENAIRTLNVESVSIGKFHSGDRVNNRTCTLLDQVGLNFCTKISQRFRADNL